MNRRSLVLAACVGAALGVISGLLICRSAPCRDVIGRIFGRGHLIALCGTHGIYQADADRALNEAFFADGADLSDPAQEKEHKARAVENLITEEMALSISQHEPFSKVEAEREAALTLAQFGDAATWHRAMRGSGLSQRSLRAMIAANLRERRWIEAQIKNHLTISAGSDRTFYETHPANFLQPVRLRASHIFQAAPSGTPPEIIAAKQTTIDSVADRLSTGEEFSKLAAEVSEDDASKSRGGDLNYFSASRMPADFFAATMKLHVRQIGAPVQTHLGFHIIQLTDFQPARQIGFEEAEPEIALALQNVEREQAVKRLAVELGEKTWRPSIRR